jgi:hypothetical protein
MIDPDAASSIQYISDNRLANHSIPPENQRLQAKIDELTNRSPAGLTQNLHLGRNTNSLVPSSHMQKGGGVTTNANRPPSQVSSVMALPATNQKVLVNAANSMFSTQKSPETKKQGIPKLLSPQANHHARHASQRAQDFD